MLIVGLGNPGEAYAHTHHNLGFCAVEALAECLGKKIKKAECNALTSTFSLKGRTVVLAQPQTYMNESGMAVKGLMKKYGFSPAEVMVLFDDFDLPRFSVRARKSGSGGTHNGMKDVIRQLGTDQIKRVRFGIGRAGAIPTADFVLAPIPPADRARFEQVLQAAAQAMAQYLQSEGEDRDFDALMRRTGEIE